MKYLTLLLLCTGIAIMHSACRKNDSDNAPDYTSKMGGTRNWRGAYSYSFYDPHAYYRFDTAYSIPDTSFALKIVNKRTVEFQGNCYEYAGSDSANSIYMFGEGSMGLYENNHGSGIMYYYIKDSIVYGYRYEEPAHEDNSLYYFTCR